MTVDFDAIPRSITSEGSVRFLPRTTSTKQIQSYLWNFGDGATSDWATPIHAYPAVATYTTYTVNLTITYFDDTTESASAHTNFIASDLESNILSSVTESNRLAVSVFLYDNNATPEFMLVNRLAWTGSHYYLQNPIVTSSIDKIGTASFSLIDPGDSTATEQSLVKEGTNVIMVMGKSCIFSGIVRRVTQAVQAAFLATVKIRVWELECDSDLARLLKINIDSDALEPLGNVINDTPGYIARRILTPSGTRDSRGVIGCTDVKIYYQLNSSTVAESVGNQLDHIISLHEQNNYDLRSRPDYLIYPYAYFDGSTTLTVGGGAIVTGTYEERVIEDTDDAYLFVPESNLNVGPGLLVTGDSGGSENVGVRWCNVTIPQGSIIITAYITFWGADFCTNEVTTVTIAGEDIGDSTTFSTFEDFIARELCTATVPWVIPPDTTGDPYSTPEIKDIIQEIINRGDWVSGNSLALFVNNNGSDSYAQRNIIDYGSIPELSPLLHIEYSYSSTSWAASEFVGNYLFFVGRDAPTPQTFTVVYTTSTSEILVATANAFFAVNDRAVVSTTDTLPTGLSYTTYYVKTVTSDHLTLSTTIGGTPVTFSTNGVGVHSIVLVAEISGVSTYGKITANGATTITCASMVGASTAPKTLGYFIIHRGYLIDFAQDVSQPYAVANLDVNKTCFEYSDNDDKRKLSTKVVVTGKDSWGKTISVALSGVNAYDNDRQFFNYSTYITHKTEGYILKNSYVKQIPGFWTIGSGDIAAKTISGWDFSLSPYNNEINFAFDRSLVPVGTEVTFGTTSAPLPPQLTAGTTYYCVEQNSTYYCVVSGSLGGTPIYLTGSNYSPDWRMYIPIIPGPPTYFTAGELPFTEGDIIRFSADTFPTGISAGVDYTTNTVVKSGYGGTFKVNVTPTTAGATVSFFVKGDVQNSFGGFESHPFIYLYGWDYKLYNGHNITIFYGGNVYSDVIYDYGEIITDENIKCTWVWLYGGKQFDSTQVFSDGSYMLNSVIYVDDINQIYVYDTLFGEERILPVTAGVDNLGYYVNVDASLRVNSDTNKAYPHDVGALVAIDYYTEASPETGSAIDLYGLHIGYTTVDNNITYGKLDAYATCILLGRGNFYGKATTWSPIDYAVVKKTGEYYKGAQTSLERPIMVGDSITITNFDGDPPSDPYEVVETTIFCNEGRMMLQLGDFEKNLFTTLMGNTNAINNTLT